MSDPRLIYLPREDATPDGERAALAACYAFLIRRHQERKAASNIDGEKAAEQGRTVETTPEKGKS